MHTDFKKLEGTLPACHSKVHTCHSKQGNSRCVLRCLL